MFKTLKDFNVSDKRVLVRCDFNVPLDNDGNILDDFRIIETLPTVRYLIKNKAKVILMSHLGEPEGRIVSILKLDKVKDKLEKLLHISVAKTSDCIGKKAEKQVLNLNSGEILLLENLRFHKEETENNLEFAKALSKFGDIYINDAFSDCHRTDASIVGMPQFLPSAIGLLLQREIENLNKILEKPEKPMVVLIGGIKIETKTKFIKKISEIADFIIVNGLIKKEIHEKKIDFKYPEKIISPAGFLSALDIDDKTIELFREKILSAKTILWNGPFGKFEDENYKKGTLAIAKAIIESKAFSVVGGGETIEFLNKEGMISKFNHVSTGGSAMLQFLSGDKLPGIMALENRPVA